MPARERSERVWRPFELGNTAAQKSGAYSPRVYDPAAQDLAKWLAGQESLRFLAESSFGPSVVRWAQRTAQADLLYEHLTRHQQEAECAGCTACVSLQERWRVMDRTAERAGETLGLDARSRAEILLRLQAAKVVDTPDEYAEERGTLGLLWSKLREEYRQQQREGVDGHAGD